MDLQPKRKEISKIARSRLIETEIQQTIRTEFDIMIMIYEHKIDKISTMWEKSTPEKTKYDENLKRYEELESKLKEALDYYKDTDAEFSDAGSEFCRTIDASVLDVRTVTKDLEVMYAEVCSVKKEICDSKRKSEEINRKQNMMKIADVRQEWEEIRMVSKGALQKLHKLKISLDEQIKEWKKRVKHTTQEATAALHKIEDFEDRQTKELNEHNRKSGLKSLTRNIAYNAVVGATVAVTGIFTTGGLLIPFITTLALARRRELLQIEEASQTNKKVSEERISLLRKIIKPLLEPQGNDLPSHDCCARSINKVFDSSNKNINFKYELMINTVLNRGE